MLRVLLSLISIVLIFAPATLSAKPIYFNQIGVEHGLAQTSVISIYEDMLGRLWFGTEEGLSIYDGYTINSIKSSQWSEENRQVIPFGGGSVTKIIGDKGGNIFFLANGYLIQYNIRTEKFMECYPNKVSSIEIYDGTLWAYIDSSLYSWSDESQSLELKSEVGIDGVLDFLMESEDKIYISTSSALYSWEGGELNTLIKGYSFTDITKSVKGELWVSSRVAGLYRIKVDGSIVHYTENSSRHLGFDNNRIREVVEDESGNIWIGTFAGLLMYNDAENRFTSHKMHYRNGALSNSSIFSLYIDKQNTLWIGTYFGGVNYCNIGDNATIEYSYNSDRNDCLSNPIVGDIVEDKNHDIWIGTEGGGLNRLTPSTGEIRHFAKSGEYLPAPNIKSLVYDESAHDLFIATYPQGLFRYDIDTDRFTYLDIKSDLGIQYIPTMYSMKRYNNALFIATNRGIFKYETQTNKFSAFAMGIYTEHLTIDSLGYIVALNSGNTLVRIKHDNPKDRKLYPFNTSQKSPIKMNSVYEPEAGLYYIATMGGGIYMFDTTTERFTSLFDAQTALTSNICYNISETHNGHILVSGDKGVSTLSADGKYIKHMKVGLNSNEASINRYCGMFVAEDGAIYVGGTNGLVCFHEQDRLELNSKGYFSRLFIGNSQVYPGDESDILSESMPFTKEITLKHNQNNIQLEYVSQESQKGDQYSQQQYMLEGFDEEWISSPSNNRISYTNLSPGSYTLRVRHPNLQHIETSLSITIHQPWYLQWWALTIWFIIFMSLAYTLFIFIRMQQSLSIERIEKEHIKSMNDAKFKFFTNISHEFKTPLTLIINQVELLLQSPDIDPTSQKRAMKIMQQSQWMTQLIEELIDFRKLDLGKMSIRVSNSNMSHLIRRTRDSFADWFANQNIEFAVELPQNDIYLYIDEAQIQKVLYNLLSNAGKNTPSGGGRISLRLIDRGDFVDIEVADTGIGIAEIELKRIFEIFYQSDKNITTNGTGIGLALTKSIIELHNGSISVSSVINKGAQFVVSLRKGSNHLVESDRVHFVSSEKYIEPNVILEEDYKLMADMNLDKRYKILLVEDNDELRQSLTELFEPLYFVNSARDGEEGVELAIKLRPNIIVSDVMMPNKSGLELCQEIKQNFETSHIPVILLTANSLVTHKLEGLNVGADDYITKPFDSRLLIARCNNLIRSRQLMHQRYKVDLESRTELLTTNDVDKEMLDRVVQIIRDHINSGDLCVDTLASELAMSRSMMFVKFKSLTGMTPNDFITNYKLKLAAQALMDNKTTPISEVADNFGFCTVGYFSSCFKKQFGVTPSTYRKREATPQE